MLAQNAILREDIQHLRNQRGIFDSIHKRLYTTLDEKKREQVRIQSKLKSFQFLEINVLTTIREFWTKNTNSEI